MSTPKAAPVFDPAVPMTAQWRSDIAWRLANGWTWTQLAETLQCEEDKLRFATETDPLFAQAQEAAWARVTFDGEADAMRRLRQVVDGNGSGAERAREVLAKYAYLRRHDEMEQAKERERNQTRLAVEEKRAQAKIEAEKMRNERAALKAQSRREEEEEEEWVGPPRIVKETEEEWQKRCDREHAERAAQPEAKVYIWGGKHALGQSIPPDESDIRVRLYDDWSVPEYSPRSNLIYWVVPYPSTNTPGAGPARGTGRSRAQRQVRHCLHRGERSMTKRPVFAVGRN